jgi:cephalosporin-C deacetylase
MGYGDMPLTELRSYRPDEQEPADFDEFWAGTLAQSRSAGTDPVLDAVDNRLEAFTTTDVTFSGFDGQPIRAWLHLPTGAHHPLPCVVQFIGYGGGRGLAHENAFWVLAGYAHLVVDTRGQGSTWSVGDTEDPVGSAPSLPGFMTRGIATPEGYYYRRLITDGALAVEAARTLPGVDPSRVFTAGASQGGGLAIAAAVLGKANGAMPDVPFLCDFPRAVWIADTAPYNEIARYLATHRTGTDAAFRTLSYMDGVAFARRATQPALFSVALLDDVCPPSTVYGAFNSWADSDKSIREWTFNHHEGGLAFQQLEQADWLRALLAKS